ncbi:hypothetical protein JJD41_21705 [Oxynema sp. CENA135]|nr:hypothetical protein [Oxynema sp. CENA135]MBK4732458.1 hypothetical protein [Oxynema sp. CENA135]
MALQSSSGDRLALGKSVYRFRGKGAAFQSLLASVLIMSSEAIVIHQPNG